MGQAGVPNRDGVSLLPSYPLRRILHVTRHPLIGFKRPAQRQFTAYLTEVYDEVVGEENLVRLFERQCANIPGAARGRRRKR